MVENCTINTISFYWNNNNNSGRQKKMPCHLIILARVWRAHHTHTHTETDRQTNRLKHYLTLLLDNFHNFFLGMCERKKNEKEREIHVRSSECRERMSVINDRKDKRNAVMECLVRTYLCYLYERVCMKYGFIVRCCMRNDLPRNVKIHLLQSVETSNREREIHILICTSSSFRLQWWLQIL